LKSQFEGIAIEENEKNFDEKSLHLKKPIISVFRPIQTQQLYSIRKKVKKLYDRKNNVRMI
jgi:hypothetical protein